MKANSAQTIPILPSPNFDATSAFYVSLGFQEIGRWPEEYLIMEDSQGIELHFWHNPKMNSATNDVGCYIRFGSANEAQRLYENWSRLDLGSGRLYSPTATDYGLLEFAFIDLNGNLLRIGGNLNTGQQANSS